MTETENSAIHDKVDVKGAGDNDRDSEEEEEEQTPLTPHSQVVKKQRLASKLLKKRLKLDVLDPIGQIFLPEDSSWRLLNETALTLDNNREILEYRKHFCDKDHLNFRGRDSNENPVIVSAVVNKQVGDVGLIVRTIDGSWSDKFILESETMELDQEIVLDFAKRVVPMNLDISSLDLVEQSSQDLFLDYDDNHSKLIGRTKYSFGVLYQKPGQSTEAEIFGNIEHSEKFSQFVELLGEARPFATQPEEPDPQSDAVRAYVVNELEDLHLKFYVLTFMPHSRTDNQQCFRKARIGNCVVCVVFQESGSTFCPDIITSQFLHVYIVVQPVSNTEGDQYQVSIVCKKDVPDFGPRINSIETLNQDSIQTFLNKLIGAEQASYRTGKLAFLRQRYRHAGLLALEQKLDKVVGEAERLLETENNKWRVCSIL